MLQLQPCDIGLSGIRSQGLTSRAIKLGTILRYQPRVAHAATAAQALCLIAGIALAIVFGWSVLGAAAALLVALAAGIALTWVIASTLGDRTHFSAWFSHAFLCTRVDADGTVWIQEALSRGVVTQRMHYRPGDYVVVRTSELCTPHDVEQVQRFCAALERERESYGFAQFLGLAVYDITAGIPWPRRPLMLSQAGTSICSGACCDAGTRWNAMPSARWKLPPYMMSPADIYAQALDEGVHVEGALVGAA